MMKTFHSRLSSKVLLAFIVASAAVCLFLVLEKTRIDPDQQMAQKIFYYHVPSAWVGALAYFLVMVGGIQYLRTKEDRWDRFSLAAAENGTFFATLVLITGPIWATPIWGTPWNWEPRLTTTLIIVLIYVGYFMLRQFGGAPERIRRLSAVLGIVAFVDVPIIYYSVDFWATDVQSHPQREMGGQPSDVLGTFFFSLIIFTVLFIYMMRFRIHLLGLEARLVEQSRGV